MTRPKKILIAAINGVGDTILFLPYVVALKRYFPEATIDVMVFPNGSARLVAKMPHVRRVIVFPWQKWIHPALKDHRLIEMLKVFRTFLKIRWTSYDLCFWPHAFTSPRRAQMARLIGARRTYIHTEDRRSMTPVTKGRITWIPYQMSEHRFEINRRLFEAAGIPTSTEDRTELFPISTQELKEAYNRLQLAVGGRFSRFIGFHPTGNVIWNRYRQWQPEEFGKLAERLSRHFNAACLLFGSPEEQSLAERVSHASTVSLYPLLGLPLDQMVPIFKNLLFFVGNDSALVHLSSTIGIPTFAVIGPTNPHQTGPCGNETFAVKLDLPCNPCIDDGFEKQCPHHFCLHELKAEQVFQAIVERFGKPSHKKDFKAEILTQPFAFPPDFDLPDFLKLRFAPSPR